jgi:hypothetical protein
VITLVRYYDRVSEVVKCRALAQKLPLKIIESKDAISTIESKDAIATIQRDMASFD